MSDLWPTPYAIAELAAPWLVVFVRTVGLAWTAPGWSTAALGWRVRLGLALLVTLAVAPCADLGSTRNASLSAASMLLPIEFGVGAMLGLSAALVMAGARQAGELVGTQAGLSPAALLDPDAGDDLNTLGHLYGWMALGVFLALDGPVTLVSTLAESYRAIPPGGLELSPEMVDSMFAKVGWALVLSLRAAAPAGVALIAAGIALGMLGRAAPSLSLLSYSLPIRVGVGLVLVLLSMMTVAGVFASAWSVVL